MNTKPEIMLEQADANLRRDVPMFIAKPAHGKTALIVGGSPSLPEQLPALRFHKMCGGVIFALNGAHDWLIERGIVPDYHVILDARPENVRFVDKPHHGVTYLIAAQCHQSVFEALTGHEVVMWAAWLEGMEELAAKHDNKPIVLIGGGSTVGLKAMCLAKMLGHRKINLFGMDSSWKNGENHAYPQDDTGTVMDIEFDGEKFKCSRWMARQADEFAGQYLEFVKQGCRIKAHGSGLIPRMVKSFTEVEHV